MWAVGVYDLGLRPDEFMRITPRQFEALCERMAIQHQREDARAGLVAAVIANANRDPRKRSKPFTVEDFMPQTKKMRPTPDAEVLKALKRGTSSQM